MTTNLLLTPGCVFDGSNFRVWKFRIRIMLQAEGLLSQIDEAVPDDRNNEWLKKDAKVMKIITERVNSEQLELIMSKTDAKSMMAELEKVYN